MKKTSSKILALGLSLTMFLTACGAGGAGKATEGTTAAGAGSSAAAETTAAAGGASGETFVIGNPQPLTGVNAQVGESANMAAALAVKVINEAGGFNGVPVKLVNYDDQGSPEEAVKIANKMIQVDKVNAILGSLTSSNVLAAGGIYNEAKIPTIGTGNSPTWMLQGWEYVFRAGLNTALSMPHIAEKMVELDIKSVAVFRGLDDAAKSSAEAFVEEAKKVGIEVTTVESYTEGDTDFSGQVAKMINTKPDAVFCSTNGPTQAIFAKQLRQLGYNKLCFNREGIPVDTLNVAGEAANNWVFSYPYVVYSDVEEATDPEMKEFLQLYVDEYGVMPFHDCAYRSWDAMMVFWEASKIAGSNDSDAIKDAISQIKDFKSLGGMLDFTDGTREGLHTLNDYIISDGKYLDFNQWLEEGNYEKLAE
ncbi:ABC transporter substrate-binding protein [Lacrimispora sp.]|uniref:ABC transporter substrate-binding protein n=1 Tax=Lacrimispora sp. TaxID=2719234 RepID=UPI002FD9BCB3